MKLHTKQREIDSDARREPRRRPTDLSDLCGTATEEDGIRPERREEHRNCDARLRRHAGAIAGYVQDALLSAGDERLHKFLVQSAEQKKGGCTEITLEVPGTMSLTEASSAVTGAGAYLKRYVTEMMNGKQAPTLRFKFVPSSTDAIDPID